MCRGRGSAVFAAGYSVGVRGVMCAPASWGRVGGLPGGGVRVLGCRWSACARRALMSCPLPLPRRCGFGCVRGATRGSALLPNITAIRFPWRWEIWTHWGLNPGPSACGADVIPLHHVPLEKCVENNIIYRIEINTLRSVFGCFICKLPK